MRAIQIIVMIVKRDFPQNSTITTISSPFMVKVKKSLIVINVRKNLLLSLTLKDTQKRNMLNVSPTLNAKNVRKPF